MDKSKINSDKTFQVDKNKIKKKLSKSSLAEIDAWNPSGWKYDNVKLLDLDSGNNYKLLNIVSREDKYDLSDSTKKLVSNYYKINPRIQMRNLKPKSGNADNAALQKKLNFTISSYTLSL